MAEKGLSQGGMDKLARRVQKRIENKVPFRLWDHAEQQYHAFYVTGGACASCGGRHYQPEED